MKYFSLTTASVIAFATTATAETTQIEKVQVTSLQEAVVYFEQNIDCFTLFVLASFDQYGLPLQFEVDADFYSKSNRVKRKEEILVQVEEVVDSEHLSTDERTYLLQKNQELGVQAGVKWGIKSTYPGIASLDQPYRDCVIKHNIN